MRKIVLIVLLAAALLSCSKKEGPQQKTEQKGEAIAQVGDASISGADLTREFEGLPEYARALFQGEAGKEKFLDEVVKKEILYQKAMKDGLDKDKAFQKKVEDFKKLTLISELLEKQIMAKAKVSDKDVKDYYEKNKKDFATTSQIKASHILVKTEAEAEKAAARIKKGEKFEAVAKELSIDKPSAAAGGDLGYFSRGQMVPEFEKAAANLKVGEVSEPVKTSFGYHIIKVTDKKSGPVVEFDKIKDAIAQRMSGEKQKEAFDAYIADLKKNVKVDINKAALAKVSLEKTPPEPQQPEHKADAKAGAETKPAPKTK